MEFIRESKGTASSVLERKMVTVVSTSVLQHDAQSFPHMRMGEKDKKLTNKAEEVLGEA